MAAETPAVSVDTVVERERVQEELIAKLDHLLVHLSRDGDVTTSSSLPGGDHSNRNPVVVSKGGWVTSH